MLAAPEEEEKKVVGQALLSTAKQQENTLQETKQVENKATKETEKKYSQI
jgi:hypothetical protein